MPKKKMSVTAKKKPRKTQLPFSDPRCQTPKQKKTPKKK